MRSYVVDSNILFSALYDPDSRAGRLIMAAIEGKIALHSTEHVKAEIARILKDKLDYSETGAEGAILDLPIDWMEKGIYQELIMEDLTMKVGEADCSLLICSVLHDVPLITGDKRLIELGSRVAKIITLNVAEF